jgi:hypothetical protein
MDTVIVIIRILLIALASLTTVGYILFQFFQRLPSTPFRLATGDYIIYFALSLAYGFAANSYYGLFAFLPLLALKFICKKTILPQKRTGSGHWVEVDWRKLLPAFICLLP